MKSEKDVDMVCVSVVDIVYVEASDKEVDGCRIWVVCVDNVDIILLYIDEYDGVWSNGLDENGRE